MHIQTRHPSYRFLFCLSLQETGGMRRSLKLIVDTSKLIGNSVILHQPNIELNQIGSSFPSTSTNDEDRRRILKDSSKDDFSSSYNPKIIQKYNKNQREEVHVNEIHRSKLTTTTTTLLSMEFTSETVILAMVGAFILFLIVVVGVLWCTAHAAKTQLKSVGTSTTGSRRNHVAHEILPDSDVQPIRIQSVLVKTSMYIVVIQVQFFFVIYLFLIFLVHVFISFCVNSMKLFHFRLVEKTDWHLFTKNT